MEATKSAEVYEQSSILFSSEVRLRVDVNRAYNFSTFRQLSAKIIFYHKKTPIETGSPKLDLKCNSFISSPFQLWCWHHEFWRAKGKAARLFSRFLFSRPQYWLLSNRYLLQHHSGCKMLYVPWVQATEWYVLCFQLWSVCIMEACWFVVVWNRSWISEMLCPRSGAFSSWGGRSIIDTLHE